MTGLDIRKVYGISVSAFYRVLDRLHDKTKFEQKRDYDDFEVQQIVQEWQAGRVRAANGGHEVVRYNHAVVIGFPGHGGEVKNAGLTASRARQQVKELKDRGFPAYVWTY